VVGGDLRGQPVPVAAPLGGLGRDADLRVRLGEEVDHLLGELLVEGRAPPGEADGGVAATAPAVTARGPTAAGTGFTAGAGREKSRDPEPSRNGEERTSVDLVVHVGSLSAAVASEGCASR